MLVLFDFDGTLTTEDSSTHFFKHINRTPFFLFKKYLLYAPFRLLFSLGFIDEYSLKIRRNKIMMAEWSYEDLKKIGNQYSLYVLPKIIKCSANEKIKEYKNLGAKILIVSASIDIILEAWCKLNNFTLITNELEQKDGYITGRYTKADCNYIQKRIRIEEVVDITLYNVIHAYGDTEGDKEMLSLASKSFYNFFK
jgi:HAD superfamily hydrolase (TIGR01490 family)